MEWELQEYNGGTSKECELRPGGMVMQKRLDGEETRAPPPTIRVRVKYGSNYHEIPISCQATFGELKKLLSEPTGVHYQDQKLFYKNKVRDSREFLDSAGVKDKSKIVLEEDTISKELRYLEMMKNDREKKKETMKNAEIEMVAKILSDISVEVERLGEQVSALETIMCEGGKVVQKDVVKLIELLMNEYLKLDCIADDGDIKLKKKMQVKRIQKYVETLDMIKFKISTQTGKAPPHDGSGSSSHGSVSSPVQQQEQQPWRHSASGSSVVITTEWETFDSDPTHVVGTIPSTSTYDFSKDLL